MAIIRSDIAMDNRTYAVRFASSPETMIIKEGVLVYPFNLEDTRAVDNSGSNGANPYNYGRVIGDGQSDGVVHRAKDCHVYNAAGAEIFGDLDGVLFAAEGGTPRQC